MHQVRTAESYGAIRAIVCFKMMYIYRTCNSINESIGITESTCFA